MAREAGISQASVQRLWAANDIKPHLSRTFKLSNDKQFEAKFWDVIGLYGVAGGVTAFTNTIRTAAAGNDGLRPATGGVVQPGKPLDGKAPTPFVDRHPRHPKPAGDLPLPQALGTQQDNLSPLAVAHRNGHCPRPALQLLPLAGVQRDLAANHRSLAKRPAQSLPHPRHFVHLFMRH